MSQEKSEKPKRPQVQNPVASQNVAGYGRYANKYELARIRPSAKDENDVAYFKTFDAETPLVNFRNQQKAALQTTYQETAGKFTKVEATDTTVVQTAKSNFQKLLTSYELQQNSEFDHLMNGFQKQLKDLSDLQQNPEGIDAETTYNRLQKLRGEQLEKLKGSLAETQATLERSLDSPEFETGLRATGADVQQGKESIKAGLKKRQKEVEDSFNEMYQDFLLREQGKLMTEQNSNKYAQKFVDLYEKYELGQPSQPIAMVGPVTPTGEPIKLPGLLAGKIPTEVDGAYFQVTDTGSFRLDARGLNHKETLVYIDNALTRMMADHFEKTGQPLTAIEIDASGYKDEDFIEDIIEVAARLNLQVKNHAPRTSIPVPQHFEVPLPWTSRSRKEPVAVTMAKWRAAKDELEQDLKVTAKDDPTKTAEFKDLNKVVSKVGSLALQVKQDMANLKFPADLNDIEKSSREAQSGPLSEKEKVNKYSHVTNLHTAHLKDIDATVKKLEGLSVELKKQAENYRYALSDTDSERLSRRVHEGALDKLTSAFVVVIKKLQGSTILKKVMPKSMTETTDPANPKLLGHSKTYADQNAEGLAQTLKNQYGKQKTVDLKEFSTEAAAQVEALKEVNQKASMEKNFQVIDDGYKAVESELASKKAQLRVIKNQLNALDATYGAVAEQRDQTRKDFLETRKANNNGTLRPPDQTELNDLNQKLDDMAAYRKSNTQIDEALAKIDTLLGNDNKLKPDVLKSYNEASIPVATALGENMSNIPGFS